MLAKPRVCAPLRSATRIRLKTHCTHISETKQFKKDLTVTRPVLSTSDESDELLRIRHSVGRVILSGKCEVCVAVCTCDGNGCEEIASGGAVHNWAMDGVWVLL